MKTFRLTVSSPDGNKFDGDVVKLDVRGSEGELAVMAGHTPFVTSLVPCECAIELEDGKTRIGSTDGGILTVSSDKTTLLSGSFAWKN